MRTAEVDYYKVLGVGSSATAVEIKQKYRQLSKQYHPDTNGGDAKRMMQINEAYSVLSDPVKRRDYSPPSTKPKAKPHQTTTNGYYSARSQPARRTNARRQTKPPVQQDSVSAWQALFFYVMAVPVAILIVTFALPFMQRMLPKITAVPTAVPQEPTTTSTNEASAPIQQITPTAPAEQTPVQAIETPTPTDTTTEPTPTPDTSNNDEKPEGSRSTLYYQFRRSGN